MKRILPAIVMMFAPLGAHAIDIESREVVRGMISSVDKEGGTITITSKEWREGVSKTITVNEKTKMWERGKPNEPGITLEDITKRLEAGDKLGLIAVCELTEGKFKYRAVIIMIIAETKRL